MHHTIISSSLAFILFLIEDAHEKWWSDDKDDTYHGNGHIDKLEGARVLTEKQLSQDGHKDWYGCTDELQVTLQENSCTKQVKFAL